MKYLSPNGGFTLFELSIVLVIIGLLAGGIVVGQSLSEAASISQAINMHTQLQSAWNSFRSTYNAIPGDMKDATQYWDVDDICPTLPGTASPTNTGTCNGNGDGHVIWYDYDQFVANGQSSDGLKYTLGITGVPAESRLAWQHLKLSNFLNVAYYLDPDKGEGQTPEFSNYVLPSFRRQSRAVWFIGSNQPDKADFYWSKAGGSNMAGNAVQTAIFNTQALAKQPMVAVAPPTMVQAMDQKMDDGLPKTGKFQGSNAYTYGTTTFLDCLVDDGAGSYKYNTAYSQDACRFLMSLDQ